MQDDTQTPSNTQSAQVPQAPITQPVVQAVPTSQPTAPVIPPVTQVTAPQKKSTRC